jgi:hypothetical protein
MTHTSRRGGETAWSVQRQRYRVEVRLQAAARDESPRPVMRITFNLLNGYTVGKKAGA